MSDKIKCNRCKVLLPKDDFLAKRGGEINKQCKQCNERVREYRKKKKSKSEEIDNTEEVTNEEIVIKFDESEASSSNTENSNKSNILGPVFSDVINVCLNGVYKCEKCNEKFKEKVKLFVHMNKEHNIKKYKCEKCNMLFTSKGNLTAHGKAVHEKIKSFECDQCDLKFARKNNLDLHKEVVHEKKKRFSCDICGVESASESKLKIHKKIVHDKIRLFECDRCNYKFAMRYDLNRHSKICTGKFNCSSGENEIMKLLDSMKLDYVYDTSFGKIKTEHNKFLRFDFIVLLNNSKLVIEYDGEQHFRPVCFGGMSKEDAKKNFTKAQKYDKMKNDYCDDNKMPLLRIRFDFKGSIKMHILKFIQTNNLKLKVN